jgi:hypothetical protein
LYNLRVPWLAKSSISAAAADVIADYEAITNRRVDPPIPVERIIERGLGLSLRFPDLRRKLGMDDVLGATFVKEKTICVDRSLAENQNEGRICFTFAHETGHWVLHRNLVEQACRSAGKEPATRLCRSPIDSGNPVKGKPGFDQTAIWNGCGAISPDLFAYSNGGFIFCRSRNAKQPIEWQADYFASCLLMPENRVRSAFEDCFGPKPLILYNVKSAYWGPICFDPTAETWPKIASVVKEAGGFSNVSKQAMIIRLQGLGLVRNETRTRLSWNESYVMT